MRTFINRRQALIRSLQGVTAATSLAAPSFARAQSATPSPVKWPVDTLRIMIPAPAGGGVDATCRKVGEKLASYLGITVIPDNKPGAAGLLGAKALAAAAPDGGTIGLLHSGLVSVQAMGGKLDLVKDFTPVMGRFNESQFIVAVHAESKYRSFADLLKDIVANPGKLNYGTGGQGSPGHMVFERLEEKIAGLKAQDVPFKGAVEGVNALVSKNIDFLVGVMSTVQVHVKSGRLRALAVTGGTRSIQLPDVPTIAESGVPGFSYTAWSAFFGPPKLPERLCITLQDAFAKTIKDPDFLQFIAANGSQISQPESVVDFQAFLRDAIVRETAVMNRLGLKAG